MTLDRVVVITMDPQPTLTAVTIQGWEGNTYCIAMGLCTSKRAKNRQMCQWLNDTPEKICDHLSDLFLPYRYLFKKSDVHFLIESQMKSKATTSLEGFIKGWATHFFKYRCSACRVLIRSVSPLSWQTIVPLEHLGTRKQYRDYGWGLINNDPKCHTFFYDLPNDRNGDNCHDMVDTYLMLSWYHRSGHKTKFNK